VSISNEQNACLSKEEFITLELAKEFIKATGQALVYNHDITTISIAMAKTIIEKSKAKENND